MYIEKYEMIYNVNFQVCFSLLSNRLIQNILGWIIKKKCGWYWYFNETYEALQNTTLINLANYLSKLILRKGVLLRAELSRTLSNSTAFEFQFNAWWNFKRGRITYRYLEALLLGTRLNGIEPGLYIEVENWVSQYGSTGLDEIKRGLFPPLYCCNEPLLSF